MRATTMHMPDLPRALSSAAHCLKSGLQRTRTLRLEPVDMLLDLLAGEGIQAMVLQAVALLAASHLHFLVAPQQHLQVLHRGRRRTPERRAFLRTEASQHQRIMTIRF